MTIFNSLGEARQAWLEVEAEAAASVFPFQRHGWIEVWAETIGKARDIEPLIVLLEKRGTGARAILPLGIRKSRGLSFLEWLGAGVSDYAGPIFAAAGGVGIGREAILSAAARAGRKAGCDVLRLERMPAQLADRSLNPLLLSASDPTLSVKRRDYAFRRSHYSAHGLPLHADLEDYLKSRFSPKERYNLRRAEKKLAELGTLVFKVAEGEAERLRLTRAMIEQKRARYLATGAEDNFASPEVERFYLQAALRPGLGVEVTALLLDGRPIATHWGARGGGSMYFLMPTFDASLERHSPGKVFLLRFLERCVREGLARLDFTIGDEDYKAKFCEDETALYGLVRGLTPAGRLYALGAGLLARAKEGPLLELGRAAKKFLRRARQEKHACVAERGHTRPE